MEFQDNKEKLFRVNKSHRNQVEGLFEQNSKILNGVLFKEIFYVSILILLHMQNQVSDVMQFNMVKVQDIMLKEISSQSKLFTHKDILRLMMLYNRLDKTYVIKEDELNKYKGTFDRLSNYIDLYYAKVSRKG